MSPGTITTPQLVPSIPQAFGSTAAVSCSLTWSGDMNEVDTSSPQIPNLVIYLGSDAQPTDNVQRSLVNKGPNVRETRGVRKVLINKIVSSFVLQ